LHPRVEYCASILLKQSWPQAGSADSPGIVVTVVVGAVELEEELVLMVDVAEEELLLDDEVVETRDVDVKINEDDEVDALSTLVVMPSKARANTTVPSVSAVAPTTVSPPVRSKLVTSNNAPAPM
jgi:hypothetical protein